MVRTLSVLACAFVHQAIQLQLELPEDLGSAKLPLPMRLGETVSQLKVRVRACVGILSVRTHKRALFAPRACRSWRP